MRKEIKYIGFYDHPNSVHKRAANIAAINKMDYISHALQRAGYDVHLVSPSWLSDPGAGWKQQKTVYLEAHKKVTLCASVGTKYKWTRDIKIVLSLFWLLCYLILHVRQCDTILVYHSPWLSAPIRLAKLIKQFRLILEVEEIYTDVWMIRKVLRIQERKLVASADSYIVASDRFANTLNNKRSIIIYGAYSVPESKETNKCSFENKEGSIQLVYAGLIDNDKCAAHNAVQCAKHLPEEYVINILGYGSEVDIDNVTTQIKDMNTSLGREACIYHGALIGKTLSQFLMGCAIGLNTQKEGSYMETAFPSKILTYLSHNLRVVSTRIASVQYSRLSSLITFSENDTPKAISEAIKSINLKRDFDSRSVIRQLDEQFVEALKGLVRNH